MCQVDIKDVNLPVFLHDVTLLINYDVRIVPLIRVIFDLLVKAPKREPYLILQSQLFVFLDGRSTERLSYLNTICVMPAHKMKVLGETHELGTTRGTLLDVVLILFKVLANVQA